MKGGPANEFISPEGLRVDGRRAGEVRRIRCRMGALRADGSAYLEQGSTKVLVRVSGPREVARRAKASHDAALLTCEFMALPFAGGQHRPQGRGDRNAAEIALCVRQVFEKIVQVQLYPRAQIDIAISLLQVSGCAMRERQRLKWIKPLPVQPKTSLAAVWEGGGLNTNMAPTTPRPGRRRRARGRHQRDQPRVDRRGHRDGGRAFCAAEASVNLLGAFS